MNFTDYHKMSTCTHRNIDFVDTLVDGDVPLYIDPERIAFSTHPYASTADRYIQDFFDTVFAAALQRDEKKLYHLLSFGREPNEVHFGVSARRSCGRGSSPEILCPIIKEMLDLNFFEQGFITELVDLHLWTDNFGPDRLSDLVANIIRSVLADYTMEQYGVLNIPTREIGYRSQVAWDIERHDWHYKEIPAFFCDNEQVLLVPKAFVGRNLLSSPGKLLQVYALSFRQKEHLEQNSDMCHRRALKGGRFRVDPPTKKEIRREEIAGCTEKQYLRDIGVRNVQMVCDMHSDHAKRKSAFQIADVELDKLLYGCIRTERPVS